MAKGLGFPKQFIPLLNLALGIIAGIIYVSPGNVSKAILIGIALGLSASGLYSGVKSVARGIRKMRK